MEHELCVSLKDRGLSPAVDKLQSIAGSQLTGEVFSRKDGKAQRKPVLSLAPLRLSFASLCEKKLLGPVLHTRLSIFL